VALEHDLRPLLGLPPVGPGVSRVFKAGLRLRPRDGLTANVRFLSHL
jgi:hypothetical protein